MRGGCALCGGTELPSSRACYIKEEIARQRALAISKKAIDCSLLAVVAQVVRAEGSSEGEQIVECGELGSQQEEGADASSWEWQTTACLNQILWSVRARRRV